jgi:archaeal type IV pilus assembly protein PilA
MNFGKKIMKVSKNTHAISPVIATLLMIAIAVVASLVVYAWVSGYMGNQTDKTGHSIVIQSTVANSTGAYVYVQNVGQGTVQIGTVYVNGTLTASSNVTPALGTSSANIDEGNTLLLKITDKAYDPTSQITFKVVTVDGTYMTYIRNP